tara:strand:+ start:9 stop:455 length:447 start_codon:yes stop_codon:yes gene_type:complete
MEIAILALGCFWGPEEKFSKLNGVIKTEVGYCGGTTNSTTYEEVCTGSTNHAEVVKIEFDEKIIAYANLLEKFFEMHDPTTINKQGPDVGTQYRSEIFYRNDKQREIAEQVSLKFNKKYNGKIVTNISEEKNYCKAENYHQKYIQKRN